MRDAGRIGNEDGWSLVGGGLLHCPNGLFWIRPEGDLTDINMAVIDSDEPQILLRNELSAGRELCRRSAWGRLRFLAARIRIDFRVHDQNIDVAVVGQHVIETAEANVVGPAIAANDPDNAVQQMVGQGIKILGFGVRKLFQACAQLFETSPLSIQLRTGFLRRGDNLRGELLANLGCQLL